MITVDASSGYEFRIARPEDFGAMEELDGSFTTPTVFQVTVGDEGFALREVPVEPPLTKVFPEEDEEDTDEEDDGADGEGSGRRTYVAVDDGGELAGFVSVAHAAWNRRLVVEDIEVAPGHRGRGVGRALMGLAVEYARECRAGHVWLEVSNVNAPAIHAYRRMGFAFCGLDTALYQGTASEGEQALFMSMAVA